MLLLSAAVRGPIQRNINLKAFFMEYMLRWLDGVVGVDVRLDNGCKENTNCSR